jgi:hypothetical protein
MQADGIRIENWKNSFTPTVNGKQPKLDDYEQSRSYAIAPNRESVLLGTEWGLRQQDKNADAMEREAAYGRMGSQRYPNGKLAIAALFRRHAPLVRHATARKSSRIFPTRTAGMDLLGAGRLLHVFGIWRQLRGVASQPRAICRPTSIARPIRPHPLSAGYKFRQYSAPRDRNDELLRGPEPQMQAASRSASCGEIAPPRLRLQKNERSRLGTAARRACV